MNITHISLWDKKILWLAFGAAFKKLNPFVLYKNPVMFITEIGAFVTLLDGFFVSKTLDGFSFEISLWLWITVLFANFAEAMAEIRNRGQAEALKSMRVEAVAHKLSGMNTIDVPAAKLRKGDIIRVLTLEIIPGDGEIIEGFAQIDESSITGESEPVIRGAGTDQSTVTAGTRLLSESIVVRIMSNPGESFLDRMINLIEGTKRKKSKNEMALTILMSGLSLLFLVVCVSFKFFGIYFGVDISLAMLVAFLICLIPTTIAGLLSAVGIAGVSRLMKKNVLAMDGQSVEAAGDIDLLLIDKTGTITQGRRHALEFIPYADVKAEELVRAAYLSSLLDETTEGRSIVDLALSQFPALSDDKPTECAFIPFKAETRISGLKVGHTLYRKGAPSSIESATNQPINRELSAIIAMVARQGGTPLLVTKDQQILGVITLKDTMKPGLSNQFAKLRRMGIRTIMMTGDNPLTAESIAKEAEIDEFIAEATPEEKLKILREKQAIGYLVAMTGDGVNDAPALAQADLGVAMNAGAQAAKEAANMIDLDSHPNKLFEIIEIGKQILMTRGALTTFSVANDVAKYFVILPALMIPFFPILKPLDFMHFSSPKGAVLSAVIFNAIIIVGLIPLAFKGVRIKEKRVHWILNRNLLIYGVGGVVLPFFGIKLINMLLFWY